MTVVMPNILLLCNFFFLIHELFRLYCNYDICFCLYQMSSYLFKFPNSGLVMTRKSLNRSIPKYFLNRHIWQYMIWHIYHIYHHIREKRNGIFVNLSRYQGLAVLHLFKMHILISFFKPKYILISNKIRQKIKNKFVNHRFKY